jgi:hypothetical protein
MSEAAPAAAERAAGGVRRLRAAWRALAPEQRLVAFAALGLLVTMFLPWYSTTSPGKLGQRIVAVHDSQTAIGAFSWVEAAVLLVALGVLALLFARGERRAFHLPGGDGVVITGAGVWACVLIVWRFFDKPELGKGVSVGLEWGIFVALAAAVALVLAGNRVRAAHRPEPPLARAEPPPPPPGAPVAVRIPDERPHLEETRVMADRTPQTPAARRPGPVPLSRESAAQDTAEFRAVPDVSPSEAVNGGTEEERTEPLPSEEDTRALPSEDETQRLGRDKGDDEDPPRLPGI